MVKAARVVRADREVKGEREVKAARVAKEVLPLPRKQPLHLRPRQPLIGSRLPLPQLYHRRQS